MSREKLPNRRETTTTEIVAMDMVMTMSVGYYDDGRMAEVFISDIKSGTSMDAMCRDAAVCLSIALQHGVPLEEIQHAVTRESSGRPSSLLGQLVDDILSGDFVKADRSSHVESPKLPEAEPAPAHHESEDLGRETYPPESMIV